MKKVIQCVIGALIIVIMVSCGGGTKEQGQIITMVTDSGGVNDQSFNQAAWEGLLALKKENPSVTVSYYESNTEADYAPFLQNAVDNGGGLVWGIGYKLATAIKEVSELHPDRKFGIIDYSFDPPIPNLAAVTFRVEEAAYLAGYLAAKVSTSKKLGFIGGFEIPIIDHFEYGFRAGALAADPSVQVFTQYAVSFTDANKGKSIAQAMAESGIDIIFPVGGDIGTGAIELARERDLYAIGVDRDQSYLAPNHILTSVIKRVDNATFSVSQTFLNGQFVAGTRELGLIDNAVGLAPINSQIVTNQDLLNEIDDLQRSIISGEIKIPKTKEGFLAMGYPLNK